MSTATFVKYPTATSSFRLSLPPKHYQISQFTPHHLSQTLTLTLRHLRHRHSLPCAADADHLSPHPSFNAPCFVVGDNIDTDQIVPAQHLTLVPSNPDEFRMLASHAFSGLPSADYPIQFVDDGDDSTSYPIIIAGANFGCGSSREHAPVALAAAGAVVIVAESYARIFFRNCVATGEIYPLEYEESGIWKEFMTGDMIGVDIEGCRLVNGTTGKVYRLKPVGDAGPVVDAGGIFAYARENGIIGSDST